MTAAFTIEALIKIISFGLLFNGKNSYLRGAWNCLDFVIVASALLSIFLGSSQLAGIKAVRILRILRPLRLIARNRGLKIALLTLTNSIPSIINLQIIVLFFIFLFAILNTILFSGSFSRCQMDNVDLDYKGQITNIVNMWDCLNYGGEWVTPNLNYDNVF